MLAGLRKTLVELLGGQWREKPVAPPKTPTAEIDEIHSLWDYLEPRENTQAHHIISVIGVDELVDMEEIRRRIFELFRVQYQNERSLYPYLKTLVDIGLLETLDVGGKRKWRKKARLLRKKTKKDETGEDVAVARARQA